MKRLILTECKCYKPSEYVDLSRTRLSVFCKECQSFIIGTSTEKEIDYLFKFDSTTDTGRQIMIAEKNLEKIRSERDNAKKTFGRDDLFDTFISNSEQILNHLKKRCN